MNETDTAGGAKPEFVHEVPLGGRSWVGWIVAGAFTAASIYVWYMACQFLRSRDPTAIVITFGAAGMVQLLLAAGAVLMFAAPRSGVHRVQLTADELRMESPAGWFGWHWWGRPFTLPLDRVARLVVNRYPLGEGQVTFSVVSVDGAEHQLTLPGNQDTNDRRVLAQLFDAIRRLRPDVPTDDWTNTMRGKWPTSAGPKQQGER